MQGLSRLVRHVHYYAFFWARVMFVLLTWRYVFGNLVTPLFLVGLLEVFLAFGWSVKRFRALRKVGRLLPPTWETRVLRWARSAVEIEHGPSDVASIVGYSSTVMAVILTAGQLVRYWTVVVFTCIQHYCVTKWRCAETRRMWTVALHSKRVNLTSGRSRQTPFLSDPHTTVDLDVEAWVKPTRLGFVVQDIAEAAGRVAEVVGCKSLSVTPGDKMGVGLLKFFWTDPLERDLGIAELPVEEYPHTIAYGVRRNGAAATIDIDKSVLIGGLTGTGKSSLMWALWCAIIRAGIPVRLWVSDPKGGMELDALEKSLNVLDGTFQIVRYVTNSATTLKLVEEMAKELTVRQVALKAAGVRKHHPSDEFPQTILILDELLPLTEMLKKGTASPLGRLLFEGRAAGFTTWANAQVGHADSLGTNRNLFPTRLCMGMPTSHATDTILGDGAEAQGAKCSTLGRNVKKNAGLGWSIDENGRLSPFRVAFVSDERIAGQPSDVDLISRGLLPEKMTTEDTAQPLAVGQAEQVAVYRVFGDVPGESGLKLLYVGISNQPGLRFAQHRDRDFKAKCPLHETPQPCNWWSVHVDPYRNDRDRCPTPTWYPDRATALKVEKAAIVNELPVMNTVHNQGNPFTRSVKATFSYGKHRRFAARAQTSGPLDEGVIETKGRPVQPRAAKPPRTRKDRPVKPPAWPLMGDVVKPVPIPRQPLWPLLADRRPGRVELPDPAPVDAPTAGEGPVKARRWLPVSRPRTGNPLSPATAAEPDRDPRDDVEAASWTHGAGWGGE